MEKLDFENTNLKNIQKQSLYLIWLSNRNIMVKNYYFNNFIDLMNHFYNNNIKFFIFQNLIHLDLSNNRNITHK